MISIIKSLIISNHTSFIKDIIRVKNTPSKHCSPVFLTFSGAYEVRLINRIGIQKWLPVDDRFFYNRRTNEFWGSQITQNTIYFNLIEKVLAEVPLKNSTSGVPIRAAFTTLVDAPVIEILIKGKIRYSKTLYNFTLYMIFKIDYLNRESDLLELLDSYFNKHKYPTMVCLKK